MFNKQEIYKLGLIKFAGNQEAAHSFVKGFTKKAGVLDARGITKGLSEGLGKGVATTLLGAGLGVAGLAASGLAQRAMHTKFLQALDQAVTRNPVLREADKDRVVEYGETVFKFAPHVACDVNLLSSILANAVHGEGIDPMTIRTLADLEGRVTDNRSSGGFHPKAYV